MSKDSYKKNLQKIKHFIKTLGNCKYSYHEMHTISNELVYLNKSISAFKRICRYIQNECVINFDDFESSKINIEEYMNEKSNKESIKCGSIINNYVDDKKKEKQDECVINGNSGNNTDNCKTNNSNINKTSNKNMHNTNTNNTNVHKLLYFIAYTKKWFDFAKTLQKIFYSIIYKANKNFECSGNVLDLFFYENYKLQIINVKESVYNVIKKLLNEKYSQMLNKNTHCNYTDYDLLVDDALNIYECYNEHENLYENIKSEIVQIYTKILNDMKNKVNLDCDEEKNDTQTDRCDVNRNTNFLLKAFDFLQVERKVKYLEKDFYKIEKEVLENVLKDCEFSINLYEQEKVFVILYHFYFTCNMKQKLYKIIEDEIDKNGKRGCMSSSETENDWFIENCIDILNKHRRLYEYIKKETNNDEEIEKYMQQKMYDFCNKHSDVLSKKINEMIDVTIREKQCNRKRVDNECMNENNEDFINEYSKYMNNKYDTALEYRNEYSHDAEYDAMQYKHCDSNNLRYNNNDELDDKKNIILFFISFLCEKSIFYDEYCKFLATRLLFFQSRKECEKMVCKMFANETGFINKIEQMIADHRSINFVGKHSEDVSMYRDNDMIGGTDSNEDNTIHRSTIHDTKIHDNTIQHTILQDYDINTKNIKKIMLKQCAHNNKYGEVCCSIFLLNKHYWPEIVACDIELDSVLQEYKNKFEDKFRKSYIKYNFTWLYSVSTCEVEINGVTYLMSMIQYEIIKMIDENKNITEIKEYFNSLSSGFDIESHVKGLENVIEIENNNVWVITKKDANKQACIINCLPKEIKFKISELQQINDTKSKHYMNSKIDAKIMREVKVKKRVLKNEIIQKVKKELNIKETKVNERISYLLENEFVEEVNNNLMYV
ncbi:hypothetical protein BDAP_001788 [Binucleata daphniae]